MKEHCDRVCPKKELFTYELFQPTCKNPRIKLEEIDSGYDEEDRRWELARVVCGAAQFKSEIEDEATIDIKDYQETPLNISELRKLHEEGMLPEQYLD